MYTENLAKDVRMKGIIHLKGYKIIADETIYPGKYSFKAKHDRERTFFFYTDTKESMRTWIKMLMKATITRDFDGESCSLLLPRFADIFLTLVVI